MSPIIKKLLKIVVTIAVIMIGFNFNWALGVVMIVLVLGYFGYTSRSVLYAQKGNLAYMKGDRDRALILLEKAYRLKSALPQHQLGYGYVLMKAGELSKAEKVFDEVLHKAKARDMHMQAKLNLATVYWLQGRRDEAYSYLQEMSEEYKNTLVYGNFGYFQILRGELEAALVYNREAYAFNDNDLTIMDNLAQNYYLLGQLNEADEMYAKVIAKTPKHAESYYYYALTLEQLGRLQEAREQIGKALEKELALITPLTREDIELLAISLGKKSDFNPTADGSGPFVKDT
ncbi:lipopolysaccharide assembly protein LapB [Paenibacillus sp. V4I5]|uniref:tetratricopeptide repeat protein n=1 Tax=Paenibacillus sp. V4I5 TaxID=3042306 RepID=UPI00279042B7|nr:tetratricopeptide repeat protein [Paenibacillus sp. V4I5]MDQ0919174.1 tetratricopeptide (TPR) repeat protein [Paenibacillus sp. V4I5]